MTLRCGFQTDPFAWEKTFFTQESQQGGRKGSIICPLLQVDHLNSCIINSRNNVGLCSTSYGTSLNVLQQTPLCWKNHYGRWTLNALAERGQAAKKKLKVGGAEGVCKREREGKRERIIVPLSKAITTLTPPSSKPQ